MALDNVPIWLFFLLTCLLVVLCIEGGYRIGAKVHKKSLEEKESPVSGISGSILGLLAFILVFTFNIVSERYDTKRAIVREEAASIRDVWLRSEFLEEPNRGKSQKLIKEYLNIRVNLPQIHESFQEKTIRIEKAISQSLKIHNQLFDIAVSNGKKDLNSDIGALYVESVNEMINMHHKRVAISWQARIPNLFWLVLYILIVLSMFSVGYQMAIAGSTRSWSTLILAISFSLVITLIAVLDRPQNNFIRVSQQPMVDLQKFINSKPTN
ncbi:hypothetical protein FEDK69T_27260 [Flavobacterium enshiense DK69]|uniref:DUF4239 domain-containing protein n=1 Tax=Flavobacterium enshiense DK69 TaxID=1107311 RepID=V6S2Z6_9FLAO|nr:DUF4239 domain-containing protein [Flavobacterium enshiense]ESU21048.1 hypothetical protein FEDK69T_27260 [Flavobacterium enshiense DK69]KGO95307.1 hypothetical protein Q767_12690 [Flavobacterium enshiense DK69]